jgi:hypothetical protein
MSRKLFGVSGQGLRLKAKRRYRVVSEYDNPTGEMRHKGAMASMVGLFVPDDLRRWPRVDPTDVTYRRDLASLEVRGAKSSTPAGHSHGKSADDHSSHAAEGSEAEGGAAQPHTGHDGHESMEGR